MRPDLALDHLIGVAALAGEDADPDREITESDPAVLIDNLMLDVVAVLYDALPDDEPFAPDPDLLATERELITRHCINARARKDRLQLDTCDRHVA